MSKSRNMADLLDSNGDVKSGALDNVPPADVVNDTTPQLGGDLASNGNDITFGDNDKAIFGAGSDLQIYHNGTDSKIYDGGTGNLTLESNGTQIELKSTTGDMVRAVKDDEVVLFYSGSRKLATTSTGIDVTGNVAATSYTGDGNALSGVIPNYNYAQLNGTPSFSAGQSVWQESGLSVSITPQYTSSRILIMCQFVMRSDSTGADGNGRVLRTTNGGASYAYPNYNTSPVSGSEEGAFAGNIRNEATNHGYLTTWHTLDHPNTTSTVTYKLQVIGEANFQLNRGNQGGATRFGSPPAMISVLEVLD